ncbi:MAG: 3-isopropylmalate dehydratase [Candidatus Rokubacteria bacterium]|nr:3-isopropylmalate dehydratase [Candidatus Rokubacteria bacterium]
MERVLRGNAWRFEGILDVDWEICPIHEMMNVTGGFGGTRRMSYEEQLRVLGTHCLTKVDADFPKKVRPGDFVVGGEGTGYGHDHDHACISLRGAGVGAVLCEATNSNFKRNAIHHGLPVVEIKGVMSRVKTGDELNVDLAGGTLKNVTTGAVLTFRPYPGFLLDILDAGGLYPQLRDEAKSGKYA